MEAVKTNNKFTNRVNEILGLGNENREILLEYIDYVDLRQSGKIEGIGNYNIFLSVQDRFEDLQSVIDIIIDVLKAKGVISNPTPYFIKHTDIRTELKNIDNDLFILNENSCMMMKSSQIKIKDIIYKNQDKIFILVDKYVDKNYSDDRLQKYLDDCFSWELNIDYKLDEKEKQIYIENKLFNNKIKVSKSCNFIKKLSQEDVTVINKELMYATVKSRAYNVNTITDSFLQQIHRPQYATKTSGKSALQELESMIGLEDVKAQIHQIINYIKVNKERGELPMLHTALTGSSGVGKSAVAKCIAKILKEENILEGEFIEVSRSDLVAGYIGQTAIKTREAIKQASKGVLFIDECYNLFNESSRDFGAECVSTLLKYMEDDKDWCVILAGYENEVEQLLQSNPRFQ